MTEPEKGVARKAAFDGGSDDRRPGASVGIADVRCAMTSGLGGVARRSMSPSASSSSGSSGPASSINGAADSSSDSSDKSIGESSRRPSPPSRTVRVVWTGVLAALVAAGTPVSSGCAFASAGSRVPPPVPSGPFGPERLIQASPRTDRHPPNDALSHAYRAGAA